jgi:5-bromo-4-chloroindolyl phosphate hydrolysis protein
MTPDEKLFRKQTELDNRIEQARTTLRGWQKKAEDLERQPSTDRNLLEAQRVEKEIRQATQALNELQAELDAIVPALREAWARLDQAAVEVKRKELSQGLDQQGYKIKELDQQLRDAWNDFRRMQIEVNDFNTAHRSQGNRGVPCVEPITKFNQGARIA